MPNAIFNRVFNYTDMSKGISWCIQPSPEPQTYPRQVIDAAIRAGAADAVRPNRKPKDAASEAAD